MPDADDLTDWCRRLKASDREAYAAVFEALYSSLFRYVRSLTKERAAARDIAQDVFVRLWDARETLDPTQSLEAYLYRTARNLAYNHRRDADTQKEKEDDIRRVGSPTPATARGGHRIRPRNGFLLAKRPGVVCRSFPKPSRTGVGSP